MPVRPRAQSGRAVSRRATSASQLGIWATASMLIQAIEHYHCGIPPCRRLHCHAGPLECRRRMGKRHMTGLMPTSAYPPIWQFDVPPATAVPQWEPPTAASYRRQKNQRLSASKLFNGFINWLEGADAHKPFILPPADIPATSAVAVDAPAVEAAEEEEREPNLYPSLQRGIAKLRTRIILSDQVDERTLDYLYKTFRRSLRRRIAAGYVYPHEISTIMNPLDPATRSRFPTVRAANELAARVRRSLLAAMAFTQEQDGNVISDTMWLTLAGEVCGDSAGNHHIKLFWRLTNIMPASIRARIPPSQVARLACALIEQQARCSNLFYHWMARAAMFSNSLHNLTADQRRSVDAHTKRFLQRQDWVPEKTVRLRFAWLIVEAFDTRATKQDFLDTWKAFVKSGSRLNSFQLWQFLVARLFATGAIDGKHRETLLESEFGYMSERWSELVMALLASGDGHGGVQELCSLLSSIGEFETVAQTLAAVPLPRTRVDVIEALAVGCDHHRRALELHNSIAANGEGSKALLEKWKWTSWANYIERMIKDATIGPMVVWHLLGLTNTQSKDMDAMTQAEAKAKVQLLEEMGWWYMDAPHLSDRQALRHLERCIARQKLLAGGVSSQTLANVADLVTRDLTKGLWGRTTRFKWLLAMVDSFHGERDARNTAKALDGWRWMVDQARRSPPRG